MKPTEKIIKRISALEDQIFSGPVKPMNLIETAEYLGLSPSYIYKLTYKKLIPHYKPTGKRIFFFKREIDEWIVKSSVDTSAALSAGFSVMSDELKVVASTASSTCSELRLGTKDPNQMEMDLKEKKDKKAGSK